MLVVTTDAYILGEVFLSTVFMPVLLHALYADDNVTYDYAPHLNRHCQGDLRSNDPLRRHRWTTS
jgi:hypothetical protein